MKITIKGKRSNLETALRKIKNEIRKGFDGSMVESIPEYYYHCPASARLEVGISTEYAGITKSILDNLNLVGVSVEVIYSTTPTELILLKPTKSAVFVSKSSKKEERKEVVTTMPPRQYKHYDVDLDDSEFLQEGETLEQYESRVYSF